jgi:glucosamine-6-phosphate deaminase
VFPSPAQLADNLGRILLQRQLGQPQRPLGLATGQTMAPIYAALAAGVQRLPRAQRRQLRQDWLSFNLDEYLGLGAGDQPSFRATMDRNLTMPLGLDPERVRVPNGQAVDPQQEADRYSASLAEAGGLGLQLLGLGLNGHVGFNEPPSGPEAPCRCVRLSPSTRVANASTFGGVATAVPEWAITLGLREILEASEIFLVVTGANKAAILQELLRHPPSAQLPASWLKHHPALTLIVDAAAVQGGLEDGLAKPSHRVSGGP